MIKLMRRFTALGVVSVFVLAACANTSTTAEPTRKSPESNPTSGAASSQNPIQPEEKDYQIVTLLPRDAIPAIDNPVFLTVEEADAEYDADELVMGVVFDGDARAYSVNLLSGHEIVNDTVGGKPISVTW